MPTEGVSVLLGPESQETEVLPNVPYPARIKN